MKACVSAHLPRHRLQGHTALDLLLLQILQGRKVAVGAMASFDKGQRCSAGCNSGE